MARTRRGFFMRVVKSSTSVMSTSSPSTAGSHSSSLTRLPTKNSKCSMASVYPGHILRPAPKGIILISLLPVMSTPHPSPPSRNRSGRNSRAAAHTVSSRPNSATRKLTSAPLGTL
uniref:Uncharacterized protein n=1 Tax=Triticum urartu TaxID=4572 RepID=A0A8R7P6S1_TRIUA